VSSTTVTNYYKQNVYDPADAKIGEISDVLVGQDGRIEAFIVSVGGFLGLGENLTMNATKDSLREAHGYRYDKGKATWVPA
jgi:hypothetical protein